MWCVPMVSYLRIWELERPLETIPHDLTKESKVPEIGRHFSKVQSHEGGLESCHPTQGRDSIRICLVMWGTEGWAKPRGCDIPRAQAKTLDAVFQKERKISQERIAVLQQGMVSRENSIRGVKSARTVILSNPFTWEDKPEKLKFWTVLECRHREQEFKLREVFVVVGGGNFKKRVQLDNQILKLNYMWMF